MITVIIPFLNEGENVQKTLQSLFESCDLPTIEVILFNDLSTDNYDYSGLTKIFPVRYYHNTTRLGVSGCRERGVDLASHSVILFLDGHMKFLQPNWASKILHYVSMRPQHLFCSVSTAINEDWEVPADSVLGGGCNICLDLESPNLLETTWLPFREGNPTIPCIMGAAYAFDKSLYLHVGGLNGLAQWGYDEQFLSIKVFLAGGQCVLMSDVVVGHLYRQHQPYVKPALHVEYNKMACLYTLGFMSGREIKNRFGLNSIFTQHLNSIKELRLQIKNNLLKRRLSDFTKFNSQCME